MGVLLEEHDVLPSRTLLYAKTSPLVLVEEHIGGGNRLCEVGRKNYVSVLIAVIVVSIGIHDLVCVYLGVCGV